MSNKSIMNRDTIKERVQNYFLGRKEVAAVYLYGSFSSGKENGESDIDIAVLAAQAMDNKQLMERRLEYTSELSRGLSAEIDLVMLDDVGELLCYQVFRHGECVLENDSRLNRRFKADKTLLFFDFEYYMERSGKGMIESMKRKVLHG